jgi:putative transposase
MAEIRIFHDNRFLCRAICAELAGETIALREIIQARNRRRRDLRRTLQDRSRTVDALLAVHRGDLYVDGPPIAPETNPARLETPRLKQYIHE